jgi:hypothetical protein
MSESPPLHTRISDLIERILPLSQGFPTELKDQPGSNAYLVTTALALLREAMPIVRTHETGRRIADIFNPLVGEWQPVLVEGCMRVPRERVGSDSHESLVMPRKDYEAMVFELERLRDAATKQLLSGPAS